MNDYNNISNAQKQIHEWAKSKGWWDQPRDLGNLLMLVVTEIAEAMEEYRTGILPNTIYVGKMDGDTTKPEGFPIELADAAIRLFDICEFYGIDLADAIKIKMQYNEQRSYRHGGKIC